MRVNGIGTTLLGLRRSHEDPNVGTATEWFTFVYFPILPLKRFMIRLLPGSTGRSIRYQKLGEGARVPREVLLTYFAGWVLFPALLFPPIYFLVVALILGSFGIDLRPLLPETIPDLVVGVLIGWCLIAPILAMMVWQEQRFKYRLGRPRANARERNSERPSETGPPPLSR